MRAEVAMLLSWFFFICFNTIDFNLVLLSTNVGLHLFEGAIDYASTEFVKLLVDEVFSLLPLAHRLFESIVGLHRVRAVAVSRGTSLLFWVRAGFMIIAGTRHLVGRERNLRGTHAISDRWVGLMLMGAVGGKGFVDIVAFDLGATKHVGATR